MLTQPSGAARNVFVNWTKETRPAKSLPEDGTVAVKRREGKQRLEVVVTRNGQEIPEKYDPASSTSRAKLAQTTGLTPAQVEVLDMATREKETVTVGELNALAWNSATESGPVVPMLLKEIAAQLPRFGLGDLCAVNGSLAHVEDGMIHYITEPDALVARIGRDHEFVWHRGPGFFSTGQFYQHLLQTVPSFDDISLFPRYPEVPGVLTLSDIPAPGDGSTLRELLKFFCHATRFDAIRIMAAFLTPFWGGPGGSRPGFLIRGGRDGKGCGDGKTTLAKFIAMVYGGSIALTSGESIEALTTRLLSEDAAGLRCIFFDNVKSDHLSHAALEALITFEILSGRRNYRGEGRIRNLFMVLMTMNGGSLAKDVAQRFITITLRRPTAEERTATWETEVRNFIEANRWRLFADFVQAIQLAEKRMQDPTWREVEHTRWALWEASVLAGCVDSIEEFRAVIADNKANQEAEDGEIVVASQLSEAFRATIKGDADLGVFALATSEIINTAQRLLGGVGDAAVAKKLRGQLHGVPQLVSKRTNSATEWFWVGSGRKDFETLREAACSALREAAELWKGV